MDPPPLPPLSHAITSAAAGGGREDCWTEDATEALVEAWSDRYLQLNRGNLRQKDWQDIANAVNEHLGAVGRPRRTGVQCKNRVDTLKKKYKLEKSRRAPSRWRFFRRLDFLIGATAAPALKNNRTSAMKAEQHQHSRPKLNVKHGSNADLHLRAIIHSGVSSSPASSRTSRGDKANEDRVNFKEEEEVVEEEDDEGKEKDHGNFFRPGLLIPKKRRWTGLVDVVRPGDSGAAMEGEYGELARAIVKFGEIYERVESSKQKQMTELEKQRMEIAKDLEYQRMQMFLELQIGLEKTERPKFASSSGKKS